VPKVEIRVLLRRTHDEKVSKERMHLDLRTDDVEAEVRRLEALGATRYDPGSAVGGHAIARIGAVSWANSSRALVRCVPTPAGPI
jgi:hypothetical protein